MSKKNSWDPEFEETDPDTPTAADQERHEVDLEEEEPDYYSELSGLRGDPEEVLEAKKWMLRNGMASYERYQRGSRTGRNNDDFHAGRLEHMGKDTLGHARRDLM